LIPQRVQHATQCLDVHLGIDAQRHPSGKMISISPSDRGGSAQGGGGVGASGWGRAVVISTWAKLGADRINASPGLPMIC
jgi:hypothetical protein